MATSITEAGGRFQFTGILSGSYDVLAVGPVTGSGPGGAILASEPLFGRTHIEIVGQGIEGIKVPTGRGRSVTLAMRSANLKRADGACPKVEVTLSGLEDWGTPLNIDTQLGAGEERVVDHLPPGRYRLTAIGRGDSCYPATASILDLIPDGSATTIPLEAAAGGSVQGNLTGTNRPTDFLVLLSACDPTDGPPPTRIAYPDAASRFAFPDVRAASYWLALRPASASEPEPTGGRQLLKLEVQSGRPLEVHVPAPARVSSGAVGKGD